MMDDEFDLDNELSNAELVNNDSFLKLRAKNKQKEIARKFFYFTLGAALITLITMVCVVVFFGLKTVEIKGISKYTEEQILSACDFSSADNLFGIDFDEVEERIKRKCPYISDVSFKRALPSTLVITVTEDAPSYCTEILGDYFLLSEDLRVISKHDIYEEIDALELPVIYLKLPDVRRVVAGEKISVKKSSSMDHLTDFLSQLREQYGHGEIDCIDASDRYHLVIYTDGSRYKIDLGTSDNLDTKIRLVKRVIETQYSEDSIASINVEKVNQIVARPYEEIFLYR